MGRFKRRQTRRHLRKLRQQMCPACLDRDAVNLLGRPRNISGRRLTGGCEVCAGKGEVWVATRDGDRDYDPFVVSKLKDAA